MAGYLPKDYVGVHTRVEKFHSDHREGISIDTEFKLEGDVAIFKAVVKTSKGTFSGSSFGRLGKEKAFEKLETVSVGRALAFAGYEVKDGIASNEEMQVFTKNEEDRGNSYQKLDLMDYLERVKQETDTNALDTLYKEFKSEGPTEKQEAWFVKDAKARKEQLTK